MKASCQHCVFRSIREKRTNYSISIQRFLTLYPPLFIKKGIFGNAFSTITEPNSVSVGNGASIFGLLGAIYVDLISALPKSNNKKPVNAADEMCFAQSALVSLGMLMGLIVIFVMHLFNVPTRILGHDAIEKDWSVLYGGMIAGILCGCVWDFGITHFEERIENHYFVTIISIPLLLSGLFCIRIFVG